MAQHENTTASALRLLNRALWLQTLDELEREYAAFQRRSATPPAGASTPQQPVEELQTRLTSSL